MEQSSTSPATNNAIRGAEQSGNIAKNGLLGQGGLEAWLNNMGGMISKW